MGTKNDFQGNRVLEAVVTSTAKESLRSTERGLIQLLAVLKKIGVVTAVNNCK